MGHLWKDCVEMFHTHPNINVNIIAHSVGAHLLMKSIQTVPNYKSTISHTFFIGADIHRNALINSQYSTYSEAITNYYMPTDKSLLFSYIMQHYLLNKRAGRAGLLGKDVDNVNCQHLFSALQPPKNPFKYISHSHSWYFKSYEVLKDIVYRLEKRGLEHRKVENDVYYL